VGTVQCRTRKKELNKNVESKPCRCWELPDCPFRLASGTSATIGPINPDSATSVLVAEQMMDEEQISEVSLVTFHLFDNERVGPQRPRTRPTLISQGACGADLYYPQNSPLLADQSISQRRRPEPGRYVQRANTNAGNCGFRRATGTLTTGLPACALTFGFVLNRLAVRRVVAA